MRIKAENVNLRVTTDPARTRVFVDVETDQVNVRLTMTWPQVWAFIQNLSEATTRRDDE